MKFYIEEFPLLVLTLICVAAILIVAILLIVRYRRSQRLRSAGSYMEALKDLIRGDEESAFRHLKRVVKEDTANIDAYLKLGDIFRRKGEVVRALQIHRQLTVRNNLNTHTRMELLKSLALDYMESEKDEQAIAKLKELISLNKKDLWGHQQLLRQFESQKDWSQALSVQETIFKITSQKDDSLLALYEVQMGHKWAAQKEFHKARLKYKDALRRDRLCVPAYLNLGDAYQQEGRLDEALESWKELLQKVPEKAYLAFERLERALYEKGQFGEVAKIYRDLLERDPDNLRALLALATLYDKKGNLDEAIRTCLRALQVDATSYVARQLLVKFYQQKGDQIKFMENLEALISSAEVTPNRFFCQNCGHESQEPLWRCPHCDQWRTYIP
jgi:lipopolysaccharide biosynthesis regulator YciM